ncbi:hypothetical protein L1887_30289 [Cichorium endivia]|nr:hypothetical protein L1887_30289 [Cichorium endivia]
METRSTDPFGGERCHMVVLPLKSSIVVVDFQLFEVDGTTNATELGYGFSGLESVEVGLVGVFTSDGVDGNNLRITGEEDDFECGFLHGRR